MKKDAPGTINRGRPNPTKLLPGDGLGMRPDGSKGRDEAVLRLRQGVGENRTFRAGATYPCENGWRPDQLSSQSTIKPHAHH